jgi:hypothetical protein
MYPWQQAAWTQLQQMRERLPHAILFYGPAGIGKADFMETFAQALLCENVRPDGHACGACASCGWFAQNNHPDYRRVRPEALEDEPGGEAEEGAEPASKSKSTKAPSKEIKIEQVRGLALDKLEALERWVHPRLQPDLTLLFDVPLEVARERLDATRTLDKFESEEAAFFERCRNEYLRRAASSAGRIVVVDSTRSIDEVRAHLAAVLEKCL